MATQSLYRRYRPRRFSEMRGQEHVVRSLRNAVATGQAGQAYLFSGPRGTGKTTSARILAKVLNCEEAVDGEPCCACASCLAVEAGTSFDVHELDAASNNGVDAMRELIERTKLGTPGRHKVYILDEVHMLSKGAEAALLKTLEEPPPHVVFVLATTDPQKVSDTIRSRTQHLQFHLLPIDVLENHIRWMADDAGLTVTDAAIDSVLRRGGGSARDTISALELVAASGGDAPDEAPLDDFATALIEHDPGRALTAVAGAIRIGRDPRTLAESLVGYFRDCFLSLMAPELVALPDARVRQITETARQLGAAAAVRGIETLGAMLVEMRHAPDPRVLLEVALVKLASPESDSGLSALAARVERLERGGVRPEVRSATADASNATDVRGATEVRPARDVRSAESPSQRNEAPRREVGRPDSARPDRGGDPTPPPMPARPQQRAVLGARARAGEPSVGNEPAGNQPVGDQAVGDQPVGNQPVGNQPSNARADERTAPGPGEIGGSAGVSAAAVGAAPTTGRDGAESNAPDPGAASALPPTADSTPLGSASSGAVSPSAAVPASRPEPAAGGSVRSAWPAAISSLKPVAKARFSNTELGEVRDGVADVVFPSDGMRQRGEDNRAEVEAALAAALGTPIRLRLIVGTVTNDSSVADDGPEPMGEPTHNDPPPADDEVDMSELIDAPPVAIATPIERLSAAFPGAQLIVEDH